MILAAAAKLQADNQKLLPPQLPTPLSEPSLRLFANSSSHKRKMFANEAAEAAEADISPETAQGRKRKGDQTKL